MPQPAFIDGLQFARDGYVVRGTLGPDDLERLAEQGCTTAGLDYSLTGAVGEQGRPFLSVTVSGTLEMACQRCLGKLVVPVELSGRVELATDWNQLVNADDDVERVLAEKEMSVAALVEDEVILALPMVPRHERCEESGINAGVARQSPFDVLAGLKRVPRQKQN
jgi:uncharacterized protein